MKQTKKMKELFSKMLGIKKMERGKLCKMGARPHYNHQTWQDGRNVVKYVPARERVFLQEAIAGYQEFMHLVEEYTEEVVTQTRKEREKLFKASETEGRKRHKGK